MRRGLTGGRNAIRRVALGGVRGALWVLGVVLIAATLLPLAPTDDWWIRALGFPRPHLAALLALALLAGWMLLPRKRTGTRLLLVAILSALALQLLYIWPYTPLHAVQVPSSLGCTEENRLSLVSANLRASNNGAGPFLEAVRRADPDIVFVVEVDRQWAEALRPLEADYPHRVVHPRDDFWGLALYSRLELRRPEVRHLLSDYVPSLRAGLRLASGQVVVFHGLHPKPPLPGEGTGQRDAELLLTAQAVRESGTPAIVAGDLNAVAWSDTTVLMQRIGGLLDPRIGRGPFLTFPTWLPAALRVPIDHVLFTGAFQLLQLDILADVGSDHLPMLARLCHAPATEDMAAPVASEADQRRAREAIRDGLEDAPQRSPMD